MTSRPILSRLRCDVRAAALVELAFALPVLVLLLFAILTYGSWLALAHAVQQSANEAARAAIPGLTPTERAALARTSAEDALRRSYRVAPADLTIAVQDDGSALSVTVAYDASRNALLALPLVPHPPSMIARSAAVELNRW